MKYPHPLNHDAFEEFSVHLLRKHWNSTQVDRCGRGGQRQYGVDILDFSGALPLRGAQCKQHGVDVDLDPDELREEVNKAKAFPQTLGVYTFLTTAKRSTDTQLAHLQINRRHQSEGLFQVDLLTWEAIERILDDYPELQDRLMTVPLSTVTREIARAEQSILVCIGTLQETVTATSGEAAIDREIVDANAALDKNEFDLARLLFNRLRVQAWDRMSPRQKFRVLANTGATFLAQSRFGEAARHFLEAAVAQPEHEKAKPLAALAQELLGEDTRAYEMAAIAIAASPTSSLAAAVRVRTAPGEQQFDQVLAEVPAASIDAEVHVALAIRAVRGGHFAAAHHHAEAATQLLPTWPAGWLLLGNAIVAEESSLFNRMGGAGRNVNRDRLKRGEEVLTRAIELADTMKNKTVLVDAFLFRAQARELLQKPDEAASDIEEGYLADPSSPEILNCRAVHLCERGDVAGAIATLRNAVAIGAAGHVHFLLAQLLFRKREPASRAEALDMFRKLATDSDALYQEEAALVVLRKLVEAEPLPAAEEFVRAIENHVAAPFGDVLRAILATAQGRPEDAEQLVEGLPQKTQNVTAVHTIRSIARFLLGLGRFPAALPLFKQLYIPGFYTEDTHQYIGCAERVGQYDIVLDVCRTLREAGVAPPEIFGLETSVLERFDPEQAILVLQERLATTPNDTRSRLRLSAIGLRRGKPELVSSDPAVLPAIDAVQPEWLRLVVAVMQAGGRFAEAVEYAYQGLRRFFGNHEAHLAFLDAMKPGSQLNFDVDCGGIVQADSAVCYVEHPSEDGSWLVIEAGTDYDSARNETNAEAANAKPFLGKGLGDVVELTTGAIQDRTATIRAVLHKYVFRYQDILQNWQLRFPDVPYVQMVRLAERADEGSGQLDFAPVFKAIDARHMQAETVFEMYTQRPCPIHVVAEALGENDLTMVMRVAGNAKTPVRSRYATSDVVDADSEAGLAALRAGLRPVIDPTALATILMLGLEAEIGKSNPRIGVTPGTLDVLKAWSATFDNPDMLGHLGKQDGHYVRETISPEQRSHLQSEVHHREATIRLGTESLPVLELASVGAAAREEIDGIFGIAGIEAMAKGSAPGSLLWTDDGAVALVAQQRFGACAIWTELVLRHWSEIGRIDRAAYDLACAKLIAWKFSPIPVNADVILAAGEAAKWNPDDFPLNGVLNAFGTDGLDAKTVVPILLQAIPRAFRNIALPTTRTAVLVALLARLEGRADGIAVVRVLDRHLERAFGLNVGGYFEAAQSVRGWLAYRFTQEP